MKCRFVLTDSDLNCREQTNARFQDSGGWKGDSAITHSPIRAGQFLIRKRIVPPDRTP